MVRNDINDFFSQNIKRPHLFILGAGATMATIPSGDKNGRKSSVMNNFLSVIGHADILSGIKLHTQSKNIEEIYSELAERPECSEVKIKIENAIYKHFAQLELPDTPTLYDYLLISLRGKDCVATFNWDPLLLQAYNRVNKITKDLPHLLFLHGCVSVGVCENCGWAEPLQNGSCYKCGGILKPSKLMYPVVNKNYDQDIFIKRNKNIFLDFLEKGCIITIWGYSAPESDVMAKQLMIEAFNRGLHRLDYIEIIDIDNEDSLYKKWYKLAEHTNFHIKIYKNLLDSIIGEFPRRSVEGYTKRYFEGWWNGNERLFSDINTFDKLAEVILPLIRNEI